MSTTDTYQAVTDKIVKMIEDGGIAPWQKSWNLTTHAPRSMSSRKRYRGINVWILMGSPYASNWWGTYKQIGALGGQVRKGEKGTTVVLWKIMELPNKATGKMEKVPFLRTFTVFNAEQADGLPERFHAPKAEEVGEPQVPEAHDALKAYIAREGIKQALGQPSYWPAGDTIYMPEVEHFDGEAEYLSTAFHEAGHSTGAEGRLSRDLANVFGSHSYGREELVAEFTAAMLSAHFAFTTDRLAENQAAYLKHWVSAIKEDPKMLVWAAGRAEKAADFFLGGAEEDVPEDETEA